MFLKSFMSGGSLSASLASGCAHTITVVNTSVFSYAVCLSVSAVYFVKILSLSGIERLLLS